MDVMDLRAIITVVSLMCFIGIVIWAYSSHQKSRFDEAANLPFADDEMQERTTKTSHSGLSESGSSKSSTIAEVKHG